MLRAFLDVLFYGGMLLLKDDKGIAREVKETELSLKIFYHYMWCVGA